MQEKLASLRERLHAAGKFLNELGFEGTRRAFASLVFAFFGSIFLLVALSAPPGWGRAFLALGACYMVGALAVAAEWFWGRWYVMGLGWSQAFLALAVMVMNGWHPVFAIYGGLHALAVLLVSGNTMMARFELQEGWRQRWAMDEFGVLRLRKTVTRASASLPQLIIWLLAPRDGDGGALVWGIAGAGLLALTLLGLSATVRLRSWGVLALGAVALTLPWLAGFQIESVHAAGASAGWLQLTATAAAHGSSLAPLLPAALLLAAVFPFAGPIRAWLTRRS